MIVSPWHPSARTAGWATICKESFSVHTATPWPEPPSSLAWTTSIDSYKACVHAKSLQSCPTLCNPMDSSAPFSMGFSRQGYWSGYSSRGLPNSGIKPTSLMSPALADRFFTTCTTWEASYKSCLVLILCSLCSIQQPV